MDGGKGERGEWEDEGAASIYEENYKCGSSDPICKNRFNM